MTREITIDLNKLHFIKMTGTNLGWVNEVDISNAIVTPKTGKWIDREEYDTDRWKCSECGRTEQWKENYCPNCGRKMEVKDERFILS